MTIQFINENNIKEEWHVNHQQGYVYALDELSRRGYTVTSITGTVKPY